MKTTDEVQSLPDRPPRHCPVCGARVAEGAKTCLMCGASLEAPIEEPVAEPEPQVKRLSLKTIVILAVIAIVILVGSVLLGWNLSQGNVNVVAELPTFTATITRTPTSTATSTQTPTPTLSPTPEPTATPLPPETYTVQPGDTLLGIALDHDLTVEELAAYNGLDPEGFIVEGQGLLIPPPTPTPGPPPTTRPGEPTPTHSAYQVYTVRSGDTLSTIAESFGVSVSDLRAANDIPVDSETIQVGQVLVIPQYTPTPEVTVESITSGTPEAPSAYAAPAMLYPADEAHFQGADATITLQWASVGILDDKEFYQVELIIPTADGKTTIQNYVRSTAWRIPTDLFPEPEISDRVCAWRVNVVRQVTESREPNYKIISRMQRRRNFTWEAVGP